MSVEQYSPDVSRETLDDLTRYHDLLVKWTPKINLISKSSVSDVWSRHIWDSAQIVDLKLAAETWADLGSGGGFPALVLAIIGKAEHPGRKFFLVESDVRKAAFLRTVVRELALNARVITERAEACSSLNADVVSARALSELPALLALAQRHLRPGGTALFLKGETWEKEVKVARESWSFSLAAHQSKTNPAAAILEIKDVERV